MQRHTNIEACIQRPRHDSVLDKDPLTVNLIDFHTYDKIEVDLPLNNYFAHGDVYIPVSNIWDSVNATYCKSLQDV